MIVYNIPAMQVNRVIYNSNLKSCFSLCPNCDCYLDREYVNYCSYCGQKLSWKNFSKIKIEIV